MQILSSLLCDHAADYQGKLCVMGAFDTIRVARFPSVYPHCSLALRLLFRPGDEGEHRFEFIFIDPDGNKILPGSGGPAFNFTLKGFPENRYFVSQNFVINLQGLPIPRPACYYFDLRHNGEIVARIPLLAQEASVNQ